MTLTRRQQDFWSPLSRLRNQLDRMFESPEFAADDFFEGWSPAIDIREEKDSVVVRAEMPGLKKEDIDVSIQDHVLSISGEKKCESKDQAGDTYRSECYYGRFHRAVRLPYAVDVTKVDAKYKDGVLNVQLPRSEEAKARQIKVGGG